MKIDKLKSQLRTAKRTLSLRVATVTKARNRALVLKQISRDAKAAVSASKKRARAAKEAAKEARQLWKASMQTLEEIRKIVRKRERKLKSLESKGPAGAARDGASKPGRGGKG